MVYAPQVSSIKVPELLEFCADAGHQFRLEASGTLLIPPSFNVTVTDWGAVHPPQVWPPPSGTCAAMGRFSPCAVCTGCRHLCARWQQQA